MNKFGRLAPGSIKSDVTARKRPSPLWVLLLPGLLASCVLFHDPAVSTKYVVTASNSATKIATITREVAIHHNLHPIAPHDASRNYVQAKYAVTAPGGNPTIRLTVYSSRQPLIEIFEYWNAARSRKHRDMAKDLEERLIAAGIPFHKATGEEFSNLLNQHLKN